MSNQVNSFLLDPDHRRTFIRGTIALGLAGGSTAYYWAMFNNREPFLKYGTTWGVRAGTLGAMFFGIRETIILNRRTEEHRAGIKSYVYRDYDLMFGSIGAGLLATGSYSLITFGKQAVIPGIIIGGLTAGAGQWVVTSFSNLRRSYIYRNTKVKTPSDSTTTIAEPSPAPTTVQVADLPKEARSFSRYMKDNFLPASWAGISFKAPSWFPLQRLSDEEYLKSLRERVEDIDDEIDVINSELEYLRELYLRDNPDEADAIEKSNSKSE
ncbi:hypothetical protein H4R33_006055 [Dimargaris cristalligena]|nr:hypothetical protein H4R33_006055 [Dimargaris cristalligena]